MKKHQSTTTNWADYNQKLEERGSINLWIDQKLIDDLNGGRVPAPPAEFGRPFSFPNILIELLLVIRTVYKNPLRQTMGFAKSLFPLLGLKEIVLPHFSTLSRRASTLGVLLDPIPTGEPLHLAIDSTGLKVYGEGEWKVRQHGADKRRTWRKVHFGINTKTFMVHGVVLSTNDMHDSAGGEQLIDLIEEDIDCVFGDGAYDPKKMRQKIKERGAIPIIPPREDGKIHPKDLVLKERNASLQRIKDLMEKGLTLKEARKAWKVESGYHKRSLVETHMYRFKNCLLRKTSVS